MQTAPDGTTIVLGWMEMSESTFFGMDDRNDDHAATDGKKASCLLRMISLASGVESRPVFQRDTSVVKTEEGYVHVSTALN
ncbi:hypothetical protein BDR05DRAFT_955962 [Suillus weaverae]|nr:hypothetical protein BDR05DRAFT_955962 [Suillus weaverae]